MSSTYEITFLQRSLKISRKDGTKFKYVRFDTGNIIKESVLRQRVGELVHWAKGLKYWGEEEVHLAVTVKFGNGGGNEADGKNDGSESEEDPVATVIEPIKDATVHKPLGGTMTDRLIVMPPTKIRTDPTMAKSRSMPSKKLELSKNTL